MNEVPLRDAGDGEWVVAEPLPAGRHVLDIAGRGPDTGGEPSGDAFWSIPVIVLDAT